MKDTQCPYKPNVICAYRERSKSGIECDECPNYDPNAVKHKSEPSLSGPKALGCLFAGISLVIIFLAVLSWIIQSLRPPAL